MKVISKMWFVSTIKMVLLLIPISLIISSVVWVGYWFYARVIFTQVLGVTFLMVWKWTYLILLALTAVYDLYAFLRNILVLLYFKNKWGLSTEVIADGIITNKILKRFDKKEWGAWNKEDFLQALEREKTISAAVKAVFGILRR